VLHQLDSKKNNSFLKYPLYTNHYFKKINHLLGVLPIFQGLYETKELTFTERGSKRATNRAAVAAEQVL
jgi:hypothetical protein